MRGRGKPKIVGDPGNEGWEIYELKAEGNKCGIGNVWRGVWRKGLL